MNILQKEIYPIVNSYEMEQIDKDSKEIYLISEEILMENAGIAIAQKILKLYSNLLMNVIILVGLGNNGGDGLVIARYLFNKGIKVNIYILGKRFNLKKTALKNLLIAEKLNISITEIITLYDWKKIFLLMNQFNLLVDAFIGNGLKEELRNFHKTIITDINNQKDKKYEIIAVDIPSGMINTGLIQNKTILKVKHTITISLPKISMIDYPGKFFVGELHLVDINFPKALIYHKRLKCYYINDKLCLNFLPKRLPNSHKGTFGNLLVIGGSDEYSGSVVLTCKSALKTGCGKITLASVKSSCELLKYHLPEAITIELESNEKGQISKNSLDKINFQKNEYSSVVFGMGMGLSYNNDELLKNLLEKYKKNILIDADGINIIAKILNNKSNIKFNNLNLGNRILLTPHIKEMATLLSCSTKEILLKKYLLIEKFVNKYQINVLLKDSVSLIYNCNRNSYYSSKGNEGMATAGSGDVLSGIIGSLSAQNLLLEHASILGLHIHGSAGDKAKEKKSSFSLIASDIINEISSVFKYLQKI